MLGEGKSGRVKYFGCPQLKQILFGSKELVTFEAIISLSVFAKTKGLRHNTGAFRHGIVVDGDM